MVDHPHAEKVVALNAERILTAALRQKVSTLGFKAHIASQGLKKISDAEGKSEYKLGQGRDGNKRYFMNKLVMNMVQHGYYQNSGAVGVRADHYRTRTHPKSTTYHVRSHAWNLPETNFISKAIQQSDVVNIVMDNLTNIRGEAIMLDLLNFFENE